MQSKTKISKIITEKPESTPKFRKLSLGLFDVFMLILFIFSGITIWNENHSSQKQLQSMGFGVQNEGKSNYAFCKSLSQSSCTKELLYIDGDTLIFYGTTFDSYVKAFTFAQNTSPQIHVIQIGTKIWTLDTNYNELWNPELNQIWRYIKDPHSTTIQKHQRAFPLNGLIPNSDHIESQIHLGFKSTESWFCKSYSLKSGNYDYCLTQFPNPNQCKQWMQQFGKAKSMDSDSTAGIWQSSDGEEYAYLACIESQGLSLNGTISRPYLNTIGQKGKDLIRLFSDWND